MPKFCAVGQRIFKIFSDAINNDGYIDDSLKHSMLNIIKQDQELKSYQYKRKYIKKWKQHHVVYYLYSVLKLKYGYIDVIYLNGINGIKLLKLKQWKLMEYGIEPSDALLIERYSDNLKIKYHEKLCVTCLEINESDVFKENNTRYKNILKHKYHSIKYDSFGKRIKNKRKKYLHRLSRHLHFLNINKVQYITGNYHYCNKIKWYYTFDKECKIYFI